MTGVLAAAAVLAVPALAFTLWPLVRQGRGRVTLLPLPPDPREQLLEEKRVAYRALRELAFEHEAGHLSADDYAALRARYEANAARVLGELDALGAADPAPSRAPGDEPRPAPAAWTRRPLTIALGAVTLLVFGITLGLGAARYSEPDRSAGAPLLGSRPLASALSGTPPGGEPSLANAPRSPVTPEMLQGMLQAARASLSGGRYTEAIAAYQAVLKRDPRNVDALTHLALIVAIGGHADAALETLDKALAVDPNYPPALLYQGQVLYELKRDYGAAARSWEKFLLVVRSGEDHDRVAGLVREAKSRAGGPPPK